MIRKIVWLALFFVVIAISFVAVFQPTNAPSRTDGEFAFVLSVLKPLLRDIEIAQTPKGMNSDVIMNAARKAEILKASDGLIGDVQVSSQGVVLLQMKTTGQPREVQLRLTPDSQARTGWSCEGLSGGELPSSCRRVVGP